MDALHFTRTGLTPATAPKKDPTHGRSRTPPPLNRSATFSPGSKSPTSGGLAGRVKKKKPLRSSLGSTTPIAIQGGSSPKNGGASSAVGTLPPPNLHKTNSSTPQPPVVIRKSHSSLSTTLGSGASADDYTTSFPTLRSSTAIELGGTPREKKGAQAAASPPKPDDESKERDRPPLNRPVTMPVTFESFADKYPPNIWAMMQQALADARNPRQKEELDTPQLEEDAAPVPPPAAKVVIAESEMDLTLTATGLNALYIKTVPEPPKVLPKKQTIRVLGDVPIEFEPVIPSPEQIAAMVVPKPERVKRLDFSRTLLDDAQLAAIVAKFPLIEEVTLFCMPNIADAGAVCLKSLVHLRVLVLSECPRVKAKGLDQMVDPQVWQKLEVLDVSGMPIGDDVLAKLAKFARLNSIRLSMCDEVSAKGVLCLSGLKELHKLDIRGCTVDPYTVAELRTFHPKAQIEVERDDLDRHTLGELAVKEAEQILKMTERRGFFFLAEHLRSTQFLVGSDFLTEQTLPAFDDEQRRQIGEFYQKQLAEFEIALTGDPQTIEYWVMAELILQSIKNMMRATAVIVKELKRVGYFIDREKVRTPRTPDELIRILEEHPDYTKKAERFDFSGLGLTYVPLFVLSTVWPALAEVDLSRNELVDLLPAPFLKCPQLRVVQLSNNHLTEIPEEVWEFWPLVQVVDVSSNDLASPPLITGGGMFLNGLFLARNKIQQIAEDFWASMDLLQKRRMQELGQTMGRMKEMAKALKGHAKQVFDNFDHFPVISSHVALMSATKQTYDIQKKPLHVVLTGNPFKEPIPKAKIPKGLDLTV